MAERYRKANMNLFLYLIVIICGLVVFTYAADGDVRLRGGAANSGRVEVEYSNIYGTVCIDGFDVENADVICKQLGFRDGALKVGAVDDFSFASVASLDIVLFNANCVGDETNIAKCPDVTWSGVTCPLNMQAAVFCALPYYEGCYESSQPVGFADNSLTLHGFVGLCRVFQNAYAGSSQVGGDKNRCGDSLSDFGTLVDDSLCAGVCGNDPFQLCGGTGKFVAVYSTRLGSKGFSLTGDSGSLTSFNYPGIYMSNERQEWTVTLSLTDQVQITFPAFDINPGDVITISVGGVNETFTSRRTWITDPISSFTVWFESLSAGNGFILNYDVYIPSAATTVVPAQSTAQDTKTTQPPATSDVVATTPSLDTTPSDSTTTDPVTPSQPPPQTVVTTIRQATIADGMATPASNGTCPESVGEIERQLSRDVSDILVINTGRPLPCHGAITRISFYAATTNQITVSVWRRTSGNALQLIDLTQLTPAERSATFVSALLPRSLGFAIGDFVGFSSEDLSPLVYSESASEATEHEVHSFSNLGNYPGLQDGMNLEVTNPSWVIASNRAYSWKITIEDRQCLYPGLSNGAIAPAGTSVFVNDPITIACDAGFAAAFDTAVCEADGTFTNPIQCNIVKVETRLSLVPILLISALASLFAVAIFVVIVWLVCRRKSRLKHGSSQGIAVSERAVESPGIRDNPTFELSTAHDLRMTDVAGRHGGNDPYIAITTPHGGPTFQVYEPLRGVNGYGYEVPINGANRQTGPEFQERPETDYEITHEYQDFRNSVIGRNNSHNKIPVCGLQLQPETDYETAHEYEYPSIVGGNIPQYESRIWASGNV